MIDKEQLLKLMKVIVDAYRESANDSHSYAQLEAALHVCEVIEEAVNENLLNQ